MNRGWISIHRKIIDNWIWSDKPFSKGQAWIDLLLMANWEDKKIMFDGKLILVKKGSHITSLRKLSEKWGWSITKTKKFLDVLQSDDMLVYKSDSKKTVYTIVNYSDYQEWQNDKSNTERTLKEHRSNTEVTLKETNNNNNNINNDNKHIVEQIVAYLNTKINTNYKPNSNKTKELINARLNEGFELDDFKRVIDNKVADWLNSEDMCKFLRPQTLFSNKFESYLNQPTKEVEHHENEIYRNYGTRL